MLVYEGIKKDFLNSVEMDTIAEEIENTILEKWEGIHHIVNLNRG